MWTNDDPSRRTSRWTAGASVRIALGFALASCGSDGAGGEDAGTTEITATGATATADASASTSTATGPDTITGESSATGTSSGTTGADTGNCFGATRLWFEDFETGDYTRWTSQDYGASWNSGFCHASGFTEETFVSPGKAHRSEITCASDMNVHRGYGGLQFDGDAVLGAYTNQGTGIEAPYGIVNTFWSRLSVPYPFENGKWFSFWTVTDSCDWATDVVTLGLENPANVLTPAHILSTGGTVEFDPAAPAFPLDVWVRITIFVDYTSGILHVWQDGQSVVHATFTRPSTDMCHFHWGAYASGDNDALVLFEDDNAIWKLDEPLVDYAVEPWFDGAVAPCG